MAAKLFKLPNAISNMNGFFEREVNRIFYSVKPDKIVDFSCQNIYIAGMLARLCEDKQYVLHGSFLAYSGKTEKTVNAVRRFEKDNGFTELDLSALEDKLFTEKNEDGLFCPTPCCVIRIVTAAIFLFLRHESLRVAERQDTNNLLQNTAKA